MNKKYLSVILFGALMLGATGTFTSCKDYDDDITNLQTQIDKQNDSLNKTLSEKLAAVESSISSLQSAQSSLDSKIAAAEDAAEKAALEAQKQAIETAKTELNTVKAELQAAIQANTGEIADVKAAVASIEGEISTLQAAQKSLESEIAAAKDAAEKAVLEAKKEAIETAKTELNTVKAELQAAIAANQAAIQSNKDEIAGVKAAVTSIEGDIESLQAAQDSLKNEIAAVNDAAKKAALEAQNAAIEAAKAELTAMKAELQAGIDANKEAISVVDAAVKALQTSVEKQMSEIVGRIEALEAFQTTTEEALANLVKADETLTGSIEKLDAELAELGQRMSVVEGQIAALQEYQSMKDSIATNKDAIDQLLAELATMRGQLSQLNGVNDAIASLQGSVDWNREEIMKAQGRVKELENEMRDLRAGVLTDEMYEAITNRIMEIVGSVDAKVDIISTLLKKQVTHVSLYKEMISHNAGAYSSYIDLDLVSAKAVRTWTFGEGMDGEISFTKGNKETFEDSFVIRVSPTTATLDEYMIRLVNSKMEDLSDLVEVKSIEPYTELLTRTVSQNGLWKVTVKLKDNYDEAAYNAAATLKDGKSILYAVMVSSEEHDGREVVSEYGLTLSSPVKGTERELHFNVDKTPVADIHNRWNGKNNSYSEDRTPVSYEELTWDMIKDVRGNYKYAPWAEPITEGNGKNVVLDGDDMRQKLLAYGVKAGKPFTVTINETVNNEPYAANIRGFYVTLDEDCAVESKPSEVNAWRSYHIKGLNTVTSESSLELTIPEDVNAEGDFIGFRVYAVNYDGSLVDPDGKAFYVYVGEKQNWGRFDTTVVPSVDLTEGPDKAKSAEVPVGLSELTGEAIEATWLDEAGNKPIFNAYFVDAAGNVIFDTWNLDPSSVDLTKVADIYTKYTGTTAGTQREDWAKIKDGTPYKGTLTIYTKGKAFVLATIDIYMTKTLPTEVEREGFSMKSNQLDANRIYNCYLTPYDNNDTESWVASSAIKGKMGMNDIFNWGSDHPERYKVSFADAAFDGSKKVANTATPAKVLEVDEFFIDNETQHATTVYYNFGKIASASKDENPYVDEKGNYWVKVKGSDFNTVFNCIYNDTYTWHWGTYEELNKAYPTAGWKAENVDITKLKYGTDYTFATPNGTEFSFDCVIRGISSKDGKYNAWLNEPYGGDPRQMGGLRFVEAHVISNGNNVEDEYFKVVPADGNGTLSFEATQTVDQTNPIADVPSTLKMVYKDMYDHEVVIKLPMTVTRR